MYNLSVCRRMNDCVCVCHCMRDTVTEECVCVSHFENASIVCESIAVNSQLTQLQ